MRLHFFNSGVIENSKLDYFQLDTFYEEMLFVPRVIPPAYEIKFFPKRH